MKTTNLPYRIWISLSLIIFLGTTSTATMAQVFKHPHYKAKNAKAVDIQSIQITDEHTIVNLEILSQTIPSIYISSKTYIENSDGGTPLFIQKAEMLKANVKTIEELFFEGKISSGTSINSKSGSNSFSGDSAKILDLDKQYNNLQPSTRILRLYFPKIEKSIKAINYRAGKDGNFWHFFEIDVATDIGVDRSVKSGRKGREGNCRFVDNPGYTAKSDGFNITKIEMCDTATILHFEVTIPRHGWIWIPSKSCIRDSRGGENLFVKSAEGTNINQRIENNETSGRTVNYKLFFPPIKKSVKKIDFREINNGGSWFVYELDTDTSE